MADRPIASSANLSGEVEPSIAVDPQNPERIAVAWQQDRFFNGASRGIVVATTSDGGKAWQTNAETKLSLCSDGSASNGDTYPRVTDPWLTFGADGALHLIGLSLHLDPEASVGANREAVLVTTSRDQGQTWADPVTLISDEDGGVYNDKPSVTADPVDPDRVYAVWHRLRDSRGDSVDGDTLFARSDDGGVTWSAPREILEPIRGGQTFGNEIVVLPRERRSRGDLVNVFSRITFGKNGKEEEVAVAAMSSVDGGRTWTKPVSVSELNAVPTRLPGTRQEIKSGRLLPRVAVDQDTGVVYVAWSESSFGDGDFNDIALSMSLDGGNSWSAPIKVNRTPDLPSGGARQTFTPEIAVTANGEVGVSYFDFRNTQGVKGEIPTDLFAVRCHEPTPDEDDACAGSWAETRLTPTSFDITMAPNSGGPFLGDYIGLAGAGARLVTAFPQPGNHEDPSSIAFAVLERLPSDR